MNPRDVAQQIADGGPLTRSGTGWMVKCPAHDDGRASLSVSAGNQQDVVVHCHANCPTDEVLAAAGMTWADLSESEPEVLVTNTEVTYDYTDEFGKLLYQVVRKPGKKFLQRQPDPENYGNGWVWNLRGVERVLYKLPYVIEAVRNGQPVWVTEGEKDADYVRAQGVCATTCPQGAGKWQDSFSEALSGADVTIWADKDEPGWKHAHAVRDSLLAHGVASVRIVESRHGKDAADHLSHGLALGDVLVTVPYEEVEPPALFMQIDEFLAQPREVKPWAIPGLMRRGGERLIITGYEGYGKSALLKQIAVCTAVGLHPFSLARTGQPKRVVFIDCENPCEDLLEDFDRLRNAASREGLWDKPELFVECHPPMNLNDLPDAAWLAERARAHQPDLLVIGPMYNLMNGDSSHEVEVSRMLRVLGKVQVEVDCALVLEHHVPHGGGNGVEERSVRPIGSSILMRWASFGYGLKPTDMDDPSEPFEFKAWRGSRRRGRSWPTMLRQARTGDGGWYWMEDEPV